MTLHSSLLKLYGREFVVVEPQTLLSALYNQQLDDETFIVVRDDETWRVEQYQHIISDTEMDSYYHFQQSVSVAEEAARIPHPAEVLTVGDLPVLPVADATFYESADPDDIEEAIENAAHIAVLILGSDDAPVAVLSDVHLGADTATKDTTDDIRFSAEHPSSVAVGDTLQITIYAHHEDDDWDSIRAAPSTYPPTITRQLPQRATIKRGSRLTVEIEDYDEDYIEFSSPVHRWRWRGQALQMNFDAIVHTAPPDGALSLRVTIQVEAVEIATLPIMLYVAAQPQPTLTTQAIPYHQSIFISYSREDIEVVRQYYKFQIAAGNDLFFDYKSIKVGEKWKQRIQEALQTCDFMQLFWSQNAADSENVRAEWKSFIDYHCPDDIAACEFRLRPVHWELPPATIPAELQELNFKYIEL